MYNKPSSQKVSIKKSLQTAQESEEKHKAPFVLNFGRKKWLLICINPDGTSIYPKRFFSLLSTVAIRTTHRTLDPGPFCTICTR